MAIKSISDIAKLKGMKYFKAQIFATLVIVCISLIFFDCSRSTSEEVSTRNQLSLNGIWDFYPNGDSARFDIQVPSYWDATLDFNYPSEWLRLQHGIYKTKFRIPTEMEGERIFLKLDRISVLGKVFLNGSQIGGTDTKGYLMMLLPYEIDITSNVKFKEDNSLELRIWGGQRVSFDLGIPSEWGDNDFTDDAKEDGLLLFPWGVDQYDGRRGIGGDVSIHSRSNIYIENVFVKANLQRNTEAIDDLLSLEITLVNRSQDTKNVMLHNNASLIGGTNKIAFEPVNVVIEPNTSKVVQIEDINCESAEYWWPHSPNLYQLQTRILEGKKVSDLISTNFGIREFYIEGNIFKLNGIRINLRTEDFEFSWNDGFTHGPITAPSLSTKELTVDQQICLLDAYKGLNMNTLRIHKAGNIEATYNYCDQIGMLVIDEAPFWQTQNRTDARAAKNFQHWVRQWIKVRRNHPSIIMWSIANECYGCPIPEFTYSAAKEIDPTRPAYHDGPKEGDFEGDIVCRHYTGGYPETVFNKSDLYSVYKNTTDKPRSEGEMLFAEGWRLKDESGKVLNHRSKMGEYDHPDLLSQAEWTRGVARVVRAMRFAEFADSRAFMNWVNCFEAIEGDIYPQWDDLSAPEIKPYRLHRPLCNTFTDRYPKMIKGDAYDYWYDSFSPIAVFDLAFDKDNILGAEPEIYHAGAELNREIVVYNDELQGGTEIKVTWEIGALNPIDNSYTSYKTGVLTTDIAYGEKGIYTISAKLPDNIQTKTWCIFTLKAYKKNELKFEEKNCLGSYVKNPEPKIVISNNYIELGKIARDTISQLHKIKMVNVGGGLSEKWQLSGLDDHISVLRSAGNLRGEEENYFQIHTKGLIGGQNYTRTLTVRGESGSVATVNIHFEVEE